MIVDGDDIREWDESEDKAMPYNVAFILDPRRSRHLRHLTIDFRAQYNPSKNPQYRARSVLPFLQSLLAHLGLLSSITSLSIRASAHIMELNRVLNQGNYGQVKTGRMDSDEDEDGIEELPTFWHDHPMIERLQLLSAQAPGRPSSWPSIILPYQLESIVPRLKYYSTSFVEGGWSLGDRSVIGASCIVSGDDGLVRLRRSVKPGQIATLKAMRLGRVDPGIPSAFAQFRWLMSFSALVELEIEQPGLLNYVEREFALCQLRELPNLRCLSWITTSFEVLHLWPIFWKVLGDEEEEVNFPCLEYVVFGSVDESSQPMAREYCDNGERIWTEWHATSCSPYDFGEHLGHLHSLEKF